MTRSILLSMMPAAGLMLLLLLILLVVPDHASGGNGLWSGLLLEIQALQRDLHQQLTQAMRRIQIEGHMAAAGLILVSFLYGLFHAAGPGHGKVIVSTYLLTHESQLRRGLLLSFSSALMQGITAIVIVSAVIGLLDLSLRAAERTAAHVETISFGLIALIGALLVLTRSRYLQKRLRARTTEEQIACLNCDQIHAPSRCDIETPLTLRSFFAIILSIGIRPCSGAVLVLIFAYALQLKWAGMAAVLAMSLGTALAVSFFAALSVYARKIALRFASYTPTRSAQMAIAFDLIAVAGGLVIFILGALLLQSALYTPMHPLR